MIRLTDLPLPPAGKIGWPWTEESPSLPAQAPDGSAWPRISIVTPSYQQGRYLEETLRSVLLQNYPNLEYLVVDGGSTDESAAILRKYELFLSSLSLGPTKGHADAVNQGFARATGTILAFLNSDDFYLPGAVACAATAFQGTDAPDLIHGGCKFVDLFGREFAEHYGAISSLDDILDFKNVWRQNRQIVQPEAFWRKSIAEKVGPFLEGLPGSFTYQYWCRILLAGGKFRRVDQPLACFRFQPAQRSQREKDRAYDDYLIMAEPWLWDRAAPLSPTRRRELQAEWLYSRKYVPVINDSLQRREPGLLRLLRTATLCARHPAILQSERFRQRRAQLWGKLRRKSATT